MSRKLILSSDNAHKVKEIKNILSSFNIEIVTKNEIGLKSFEVIEDESTLEGNAFKKATELAKLTNGIVLADDTGLFVDALDGAPGVYSARYAGEPPNDENNRKLLLEKLKNIPDDERTAYFKTVIALVMEDGSKYKAEGICKGKISFEEKGTNGFGYDNLFIVEGSGKTFSEMSDDEKNSLSHRANALANLREVLGKLLS